MSDTSIKERIQYRREHAVDPESFLRDAGAVEDVDGSDELAFSDPFAAQIEAQVDVVRDHGVDRSDIARIFGVPEDEVSEPNRPYTAYKVIHTIWNWPSEGALVLDVATDAALRERTDEWDDVPPRQRYRILQAVRGFHDTCPFCDGDMFLNDTLVQSCCSDREVVTVHCENCSRRYLEFSSEQPQNGGAVANPSLRS